MTRSTPPRLLSSVVLAWALTAVLPGCSDVDLDLVLGSGARDQGADASLPTLPPDAMVADSAPDDAGPDSGGEAGLESEASVPLDAPTAGDGDAAAARPCVTSSDCLAFAPMCDPAAGICVQCLSGADCSGNTPHCALSTHTCFSCLVDSDCATGMACNKAIPRCASKCTNGTECNGSPCDLSYGYCVECLHDTDCPQAAPHCILPQRICGACLTNFDCGDGGTCGPNSICE